jgi:cell wall-associated NlpC family hydrolase
LAQKPGGRRRADVQVSILEQFDLLPRRDDKQSARLRRAARKAAKREAQVERMLAEELGSSASEATALPNFIVRAVDKVDFKRKLVSYGTMAVAAGIVTSFSLPSYAFSPDVAAQSAITTAMNSGAIDGISTQKFTVGQIVATQYVSTQSRYRTGSVASIVYRRQITEYRNWSGPSAADWISNPKYTTMTPDLIMRVASQYVGTPYVFGGDNPRGFDCSGYVQYVFSQFGIAMAHSVIAQDYMVDLGYAVRVKPEDARPGDIVILNDLSHDGIYAGNGQFYHAPRPGDRVKLADIFTPNYHIIRILPR